MHFLRFILFSALIISCSKGDSVITFLNINDDHTIGLTQTLSNQGGILAISIKTKQEFRCNNHDLNYLFNQNENSVSLWLNGYNNSKKCSNIPGIVTTNIGLKPYSQNLDLKVTIKYETAIEKVGKLNIENGTYSIQLGNDFGISSLNNNLRLIEPNTFWGQIWTEDSKAAFNQAEWADLLKKYSVSPVTNGDYTYFNVGKDYYTLNDQVVQSSGLILVGQLTKSNFNQLITELNTLQKIKYSFRSFDDKKYEK